MKRDIVEAIIASAIPVVGTDKDRLSIAIGVALGLAIPVITEDKDQRTTTTLKWIQNCSAPVRNFISQFNERHLINTDTVEMVTKCIWEYRHRLVNPNPNDGRGRVLFAMPIEDVLNSYSLDTEEAQSIIMLGNALYPKIIQAYNDANPNNVIK